MDAICATGLPWMMVPKSAGGLGESMRCQIEVTAELAKESAGAAWTFGLLCGVTGAAASLPQQSVRRIFKTGSELVCGVTMYTGTAWRVKGGYIVALGLTRPAHNSLHGEWVASR